MATRRVKKRPVGEGLTIGEMKAGALFSIAPAAPVTDEGIASEEEALPAPIEGGLWWREMPPGPSSFVMPRPPIGYDGTKALYLTPKGMLMPEGAEPPRPMCQHGGCHHIGVHESPGGPLCTTCRDIHRGVPEKGVRYPHGLPPWRGYKKDEGM